MAATSASAPLPSRPTGTPSFFERRRTDLLIALGVLLLALYPLVDSALGLGILIPAGWILIFAMLAMGLNIVVGYAGLLDLGYAAFFAIGAYTMGFLTSPSSVFVQRGWVPEFFQHFWSALLVSWIVAAIFGVLLGAPTLRLRGDYLAVVTLGFGEIVPNFFKNAENITNGVNGVNPIARPHDIAFLGIRLSFGPTDLRNWFWLILVIATVSLLMIRRLHMSRLGRTWASIREDEIAASSMGVNLVRTKLWAFALGASFAGFAGSVYASWFQVVDPSAFLFSVSVTILAMVILGGIGNIYGVVAGAFMIGIFDRVLADKLTPPLNRLGEAIGSERLAEHDLTGDRYMVFGLALIIMMLIRPEGLFPSQRRRREMHPETTEIVEHGDQGLFDVKSEGGTASRERQ